MSLDINVYCKQVSADLVPKMMKRLNDFDMIVEVHPDFKFDPDADIGFLPFKFQFKNPRLEILKNKQLKSGFEIYIADFGLVTTKEALKPKLSFFDKLLRKKQPEIFFASPEIEKRLQDCKKMVSFVWHSGDSFELRFASLASAILTELTSGVCTYPADDIWYDNKNIVNTAYKEVKEYEESLDDSSIEFHEFDEW